MRRETFAVSGPVALVVRAPTGTVEIEAVDTSEAVVELEAQRDSADDAIEAAVVELRPGSDRPELLVDVQHGFRIGGKRGFSLSIVFGGGPAVRAKIRVPTGSSVEVESEALGAGEDQPGLTREEAGPDQVGRAVLRRQTEGHGRERDAVTGLGVQCFGNRLVPRRIDPAGVRGPGGGLLDGLCGLAAGEVEHHQRRGPTPEQEQTARDLASLGDVVASAAVVPVGISDYLRVRTLRPVTPEDAADALDRVARLRREFRRMLGRGLIFPADELFLLAGRKLPGTAYYEDFPQIQNGVGLTRVMLADWRRARRRLPDRVEPARRVASKNGDLRYHGPKYSVALSSSIS